MKLITDGIYYKGTRDGMSPHFPTEYKVGTTIKADRLDTDTSTECSHGIHVCDTVAQALRWGKDVFEVQVPSTATMVRAGGKLRVSTVTVVKKVNLSGADLRYANLTYANFNYANTRDTIWPVGFTPPETVRS